MYCNYTDLKPMSVVVCCQQYSSDNPAARGFGDLVHGVRVIQVLRKYVPNKNIGFIAEYYGNVQEKKIFDIILKTNNINYILINEQLKQDSSQNIIQAKAKFWLDNAKSLINGPFHLISLVKHNENYFSKLLFFREYEDNIKHEDIKTVIERIGITRNILHIVDYSSLKLNDEFESPILQLIHTQQKSYGSRIYFLYTTLTEEAGYLINAILANILCIEKNNTNDISVITTAYFDLDFQEDTSKIINSLAYNSQLKLTFHLPNNEQACIDYKIKPNNRIIKPNCKNISIINPFPLTEHDMLKLNLIADCIHSNGDISFSDALSAGKIPIVNKKQKDSLFIYLRKKLKLLYDNNPVYNNLIDKWNILIEGNAYSHIPTTIISRFINNDFSCLSSNEWDQLQHDFTSYVKENNKLEKIIVSHVANCDEKVRYDTV